MECSCAFPSQFFTGQSHCTQRMTFGAASKYATVLLHMLHCQSCCTAKHSSTVVSASRHFLVLLRRRAMTRTAPDVTICATSLDTRSMFKEVKITVAFCVRIRIAGTKACLQLAFFELAFGLYTAYGKYVKSIHSICSRRLKISPKTGPGSRLGRIAPKSGYDLCRCP